MRRRWSSTSKIFAALAVVSGLGAFALVRGYALRLERLRPALGPPIAVVEAARPLVRGTLLTQEMLRTTELPSEFAPPGALRSLEQAVGRTLVSDVAGDEVLTRTRIDTRAGPVASQVPSGLRAFTIPSGMPSDAVRPGDRVDVLGTFGGPHPHTETVASSLEVLELLDAAGSSSGAFGGGGSGPSLVLLVSPDAAEHLAYAKAFADLTVVIAPPAP